MDLYIEEIDDASDSQNGIRGKWSVEQCVDYVMKCKSLPTSKRKRPLHEVLHGSSIKVDEATKEQTEEYKQRIQYLRNREAQREYERMVNNIRTVDKSLHISKELQSPMDYVQNAFGVLIGALTVGFFFFYCTYQQMGKAIGLSLGVITFALMLVLETVLLMARYSLADHRSSI